MAAGIEAIHAYFGKAYIDVEELFTARSLDQRRFANLLMQQKAVAFPCEDPVTNAVNAAQPLLSNDVKQQVCAVITATESGLDFGKSLSTYVHFHLGLPERCRLFEVKQACYAATAALQMAAAMIEANVVQDGKILVIATDVARAAARHTYAEPSQGTGAVAFLVGDEPDILALDLGINGICGYEVMDTCRPQPDLETGDPDLSLLSYLDCLEKCFQDYQSQVEDVDLQRDFAYLLFHTPFVGMVKGAHRKLLRMHSELSPAALEEDYQQRVAVSMKYNARVGNLYSASLYLALCGLLDSISLSEAKRVGLFSYGSGCSAEFFSGVIAPQAVAFTQALGMSEAIEDRVKLSIEEYDKICDHNEAWLFGMENKTVDNRPYQGYYDQVFAGKGLLTLTAIEHYHREYQFS